MEASCFKCVSQLHFTQKASSFQLPGKKSQTPGSFQRDCKSAWLPGKPGFLPDEQEDPENIPEKLHQYLSHYDRENPPISIEIITFTHRITLLFGFVSSTSYLYIRKMRRERFSLPPGLLPNPSAQGTEEHGE
jgi:hypothetical protein